MAIIVDFQAHARRTADRTQSVAASAEIVLFPGVRYEYWEEKPATAKRLRRQAKRDLLEIEG